MSTLWKRLRVGLLALLLAAGSVSTLSFVTGCEDDGPAEEAGENIDDTAEETGDELEEETD
ncbi:MAG: hypothetical protein ACOCXY_00815 [Planctomycetota bacterium]